MSSLAATAAPVAHPPHRPVPASPSLIAPLDSHNQRLLDAVHPPAWRNPTAKDRYHLVVIGAGTGGLVSAAIAAGLGARVALIERHLMGGDCLNVGCVPSKGIIRAARAWQGARDAHATFGGPRTQGDGDFAMAMERMRRLRADIAPVDGAERFRELGVDVFLGDGRFVGRDTIEVDGQRLRFRRAIVATGARAAVPPIPGLADVPYLTNETVFSLTERPRHLVVLGAGPIGCEMAQAFRRLGSEVTLISRDAQVLPREDADAAQIVQAALVRDGVRFEGQASVDRVERAGNDTIVTITVDGRTHRIAGDHLLVAIGRAPNVEGLGLEAAGIAFDKRGVTVSDQLRTSNPAVYAVGDVASAWQFTHAADFLARIAVQNALFFGRGKASSLVMPWCTYTSPELAHVGMSEAQAAARGIAVDSITLPLHENDRALLDGESEGFVRVHVRRGTDTIVGATIVAEHAGEMISELTVAITNRIGLSGIGKSIHPYPTQADAIRRTADLWRRRKLTPTAKAAFAKFFAVFR
ncbi:MAG: mercuric reductase [Gemmatimonadaceae bacterium]|jgi:pyruvate/2-oxoglutarate dehydrogenase complex dihydrolipoamide dehydrogenase (E3) component|nr:mercuric reductase [Gemmatimonadaceae bacterium]